MEAAFSALPLDLGEYRGERRDWDERTVKASGADAYGSVCYVDTLGRIYEVFVGGALRNDENFHAPNVCMPTAGWETLAAAEQRHPLGSQASPAMQRLLLQRGEERMLVYYWFQAGDHLAGNEWDVRIRRLVDLLGGRDLPPTLIISVYVSVEDDVPAADSAAKRFLDALAPYLRAATSSGGIHG
ncbi:MAG: EpsI family protein, partial [Planctomycetes bacterium]|nr:EpsI family protein [Planctomycetota bacterium]